MRLRHRTCSKFCPPRCVVAFVGNADTDNLIVERNLLPSTSWRETPNKKPDEPAPFFCGSERASSNGMMDNLEQEKCTINQDMCSWVYIDQGAHLYSYAKIRGGEMIGQALMGTHNEMTLGKCIY